MDAEDVGAATHRQRDGRDRAPLTLARRQPSLPGTGEDGADEVLARERDVERRPQLAQLAEPSQDLQVLLGGEVEVESGVDRDLLLADAKPQRRLDSPPEPGLEVVDDVAVLARWPVDARRTLNVHQHVAAARLGDELEHLLRAAGDVVDRYRAGPQRLARNFDREGVGRDRDAGVRQSLDRRDQRSRLGLGRNRRPALRRHRPHVEHVEAGLDQRQPVLDRLLRRAAPRPLEHGVGGDVDDPCPKRLGQSEGPIGELPRHVATVAAAPMALRCVYTDLDGTLLGKGSSLFRDAEGAFSLAQARGLEACQRAGVEVVIMSGRREPQVHEAARLMGQTSYIYEAGCAFAIDGEKTLLTGDLVPDEEHGTVYEQIESRGIPAMLFERFEGRLEYHSPWHHGRVLSHLFRGKVDVAEANELLGAEGHGDLRLLDNGAIGREMPAIDGPTHAYHLVPRLVSKANAVAAHARARGYDPAGCIAVGDSVEDLEVAAAVGRFFVVANGPERDPGLRAALAAWDNATVTEGSMGDGFYEAVVTTLVERR